jgi:hypothetical protein
MKKQISIKEKIIDYVYTISNQPVIFRDLLSANSHYNEGMYVDAGKLGFRMRIWKAYLAYAGICAIVLIPLFLLLHKALEHLNFHISIIGSIIATAAIFIGFTFFKSWLRDGITLKLIKKVWAIHFPYFSYEKYSKKVEDIYNESLKKEIHKKDLQQYVLEQLVATEDK